MCRTNGVTLTFTIMLEFQRRAAKYVKLFASDGHFASNTVSGSIPCIVTSSQHMTETSNGKWNFRANKQKANYVIGW